MATLTTQQIKQTGVLPTYAAAAGGGDEFVPGDTTFLHVKNGGGSSQTVTITTPGTAFGQAIADVAVAVPATSERMIGPLPANEFKGDDGLAAISYSGVTSLTVAVLAF